MRIIFPDGREGIIGIADWQFWDLVDIAKLGQIEITLRVKIKDDICGWRTVNIPLLTVADFTKKFIDGQLVLFEDEEVNAAQSK